MGATRSKLVGFDEHKIYKRMLNNVVGEQTARLIAYAQDKIVEIGDQIKTYHSKNNMDRTGNLLDSLCWGVSYNHSLVKFGFYREAKTSGESYLHEWFSGDVKYLLPVNGHQLAQDYIQKYGNNPMGGNGWKVFFAILAPYWGYWEKGFTLKAGFGSSPRFLQFAVMTQFYDNVKADLKPARVRFRVSVAKYDRTKLEKRWQKISGL